MARILSRLSHSGEEDATSGLLSRSPRYRVDRSIMDSPSGRGRHRGEIFVVAPARGDVVLRELEQALCRVWIAVSEHRVPRLVVRVDFQRHAGCLRIELQ